MATAPAWPAAARPAAAAATDGRRSARATVSTRRGSSQIATAPVVPSAVRSSLSQRGRAPVGQPPVADDDVGRGARRAERRPADPLLRQRRQQPQGVRTVPDARDAGVDRAVARRQVGDRRVGGRRRHPAPHVAQEVAGPLAEQRQPRPLVVVGVEQDPDMMAVGATPAGRAAARSAP